MLPATLHRHFHRFFPPACAGCDGHSTPSTAFCPVCRPVAPRLTPPYCTRCALPMTAFANDGAVDTDADPLSECSRCRDSPPAFDEVLACWQYDEAVADAIRRLKYGGDLPALRALCRGARRWFDHQLDQLPPETPLIPVPSHSAELRNRGFHVPTLALRWLGAACRIRLWLKKKRKTARQAGLTYDDRQKNVRDVFTTTADATDHAVVFDDVMTTGATADAAAQALKSAGFERVSVFVFARAAWSG